MKYWGFYVTEELKAQTIKCAKAANESDSEYIRWAIVLRNQLQMGGNPEPKLIKQTLPFPVTPNNLEAAEAKRLRKQMRNIQNVQK